MLSPPDGLSQKALAAELARGWGLSAATLAYSAVGFGSHHWEAVDTGGTRWFVTVDELSSKQLTIDEPLERAFGRLRASLAVAQDLSDSGLAFVVAPVKISAGAPLTLLSGRFAVAVYPFVDGQSFSWAEFSTPAHRWAVLDLVVSVHTAPPAVCRRAIADEFAIPHRDALELAMSLAAPAERGPYSRPVALLLHRHRDPIQRLLARYDALAGLGRAGCGRAVLTHGEPHPGNTMLTAAGWRLIDWDTALLAPPERDLWDLDPGDGSVHRAYEEATGVRLLPSMLELYRIRWDLADLAVDASRFRAPHSGNADDDQSWNLLSALAERIAAQAAAG